MKVLITGAAGVLGRKLAARLIEDERINGKPIQQITLFDVVEATAPNDAQITVTIESGDLRDASTVERLMAA